MLDIVAKAIDQFYIKKNYALFREYCSKAVELPEELKYYLDQQTLSVEELHYNNYPSRLWRILFKDYKKHDLKISCTTSLQISKIAPLFYINHFFTVKIKDKQWTEGLKGINLEGSNDQPYFIEQARLEEQLRSILPRYGYHEIFTMDMQETVDGLEIPENIEFSIKTPTVNLLLFVDIFEICSRK